MLDPMLLKLNLGIVSCSLEVPLKVRQNEYVGRLDLQCPLARPKCLVVPLHRYDGLDISRSEGVHVGQSESAGAVAAVELGLVLATDDGEGAWEIRGVFAVEAVGWKSRASKRTRMWRRSSSFQMKGGPP